jgi:hypothetical protein
MDHPDAVSGVEGLADLSHDLDGFFGRKFLLFAHDGPKIAAIHELHGDELDAAGVAQIIDANDVPVRDLTREQQFLLEAGEYYRIGGQFRLNQFQSYRTVKFPISGSVNRPHSTFAKELQYFVTIPKHVSWLQKRDTRLDTGGRGVLSRRRVWWRAPVSYGDVEIHQSGPRIGLLWKVCADWVTRVIWGKPTRAVSLDGNSDAAKILVSWPFWGIEAMISFTHALPGGGTGEITPK